MENWRPVQVIVSHWAKWDRLGTNEERVIPLRLIRTEKMNEETGKIQWFYKIESPKSPLPVKGEFHSNMKMLREFLVANGFFTDVDHGTETIRYVYIEK